MSLSNSLIGIQTLNNSWDYQYSPVHADNNITTKDLIALSAQAGAQVVRIPVDLSTVEANGFPRWMLDSFRSILDYAASQNVQVIFQPGQTPIDLSNDGTVSGQPGTTDDLIELAGRFGKGVEQIYRDMPELTHMINGWEVGNEPNLSYDYTGSGYEDYNVEDARFWTVRTDNAEKYAEYLAATSTAIKSIGNDIPVYAAGVAHNDVRYLETLFSSLEKLDADLDGFSIHPYTTYAIDEHGNIQGPESGRPTDWIGGIGTTAEAWDYYYSFQGALETAQSLMQQHGYADAQLWVTEFGVPSHLGNRNAGEDGLIDQARWFAEAFGVFDSMELPTLSGVIAHHALDNQSYEENLSYDAYDEGFRNDGTWFEAEDAFGLFHEVDGIIEEKPAARLMDAVAGKDEYRFENIHSVHTGASHDYSAAASTSGLTEGIITLVHDGDDHVTGSQFSDSVFAGNGDDTVFGGAGEDRIFGGYGNDILRGDAGNDDLYGNAGNDIIYAGENDRVDGGSGTDRVIVDGFAADYSVFNDGEQIQIVGNDANIIGRNVEVLQFGDGSMVELSKPGPLPNPGTTPEPEPQPDPEPTPAPQPDPHPLPSVEVNRIRDIEGVTQYLEGSSGKDVFIINSKANRYDWDLTQDGEGIVVWNKRTDNHDILYDFDKIRFSDTAVDITGSQEPAPVGSTLPNNPAPQIVPEVVAQPVPEMDSHPSPVLSETGIRVHDIAGTTQYLEGESGRDIFVIGGNSSEFDWDLTQDGTGIVVWSHETHEHDILWDFEELAFTDTTIDLIVA